MKRLLDIGFSKVGHWYLADENIYCELEKEADSTNILYCFSSDGIPLYVGKTTQKLKTRMYGYFRPGPSQSTNKKGNKNIKEYLENGKEVDIYALPDNGLLHFGAFHINLAAGLEDSIVAVLNPIWNKTGTANKASEGISRSSASRNPSS